MNRMDRVSAVLDQRDVANRWHVSVRTVRRLSALGAVAFFNIGRKRLFRLSDIEDYESRQRSRVTVI